MPRRLYTLWQIQVNNKIMMVNYTRRGESLVYVNMCACQPANRENKYGSRRDEHSEVMPSDLLIFSTSHYIKQMAIFPKGKLSDGYSAVKPKKLNDCVQAWSQ